MFAARSLLAAPLLLVAIGSGCALWQIDDAIEDALESPSTSGPFEIEARLGDGLDPSLVRAGLFDVDDLGEDQAGEPIAANIDVLVSVEGKAKLINAPDGVDTVAFRPIALVEPSASGSLVVDLPDVEADDQGYALVVWYDADADGALTLSSREEASEFARAPSRVFPESDGQTMALHSIWPVAPEDVDDADGTYHAAAATREDTEDGEQVYRDNWVADRELTGWTVELADDSM